jgi:hypothetical protein
MLSGNTIVKLSNSPTETSGYLMFSTSSKNIFNSLVAPMGVLFLEIVFPILHLTTFNIVALLRFKKVIDNKRKVLNDPSGKSKRNKLSEKANHRFTRLIITLTFICILTRVFDMLTSILMRLKRSVDLLGPNGFLDSFLSNENNALLFLLKQTSFMLLFWSHALDGVLYFFYDKQMESLWNKKA